MTSTITANQKSPVLTSADTQSTMTPPRPRKTRRRSNDFAENLHQRKPLTTDESTTPSGQSALPHQQTKAPPNVNKQMKSSVEQSSSWSSDAALPNPDTIDLHSVVYDATAQPHIFHTPLHGSTGLAQPKATESRARQDNTPSRNNPDDDGAQPLEINLGNPRPPRPILSMSAKPNGASREKHLLPGHKINGSVLGTPSPPAPLVSVRSLTWISRSQTLNFGLEHVIADRREREIEMDLDLDSIHNHLENEDGSTLRSPPGRSKKHHQHRGARLYGRGRSGQKARPAPPPEIIRTGQRHRKDESMISS